MVAVDTNNNHNRDAEALTRPEENRKNKLKSNVFSYHRHGDLIAWLQTYFCSKHISGQYKVFLSYQLALIPTVALTKPLFHINWNAHDRPIIPACALLRYNVTIHYSWCAKSPIYVLLASREARRTFDLHSIPSTCDCDFVCVRCFDKTNQGDDVKME